VIRRRRSDHGQATVELALLLPLVALLLLGLVQVAMIVRDQVLVTHAAREAVRAAAVDGDPGAAARAARRSSSLEAGRLEVEVADRGAVGSRVRAVVRYRVPSRLPLLGDLVLTSAATMRVER
jgi:TadE-like protein